VGRFRSKIQYSIDGLMSRGPVALLLPLGIIVLAVLIVITIAVVLSGAMDSRSLNVIDTIWTVFGYMYVPVAVTPEEGGWSLRLLLFAASLTGIVVLSTLISLITTGFSSAIANLRKGKSTVEETGHTLIVGWNDQIYGIVQELMLANANVAHARIVILAAEDKVEMEDRLRARIKPVGSTKIVCRSGSPIDLTDLSIVRPALAKSIIVLAPDDTKHPDSLVIKTLLALEHLDDGTGRAPVVATMSDVENIAVASIIGGNRVRLIPNERVISQIITQTCRQAGLSRVYSELLDYEGDEIYVAPIAEAVGQQFNTVARSMRTCTLLGIRDAKGSIILNPPGERVITADDLLVVLAEDDDRVTMGNGDAATINIDAILPAAAAASRTESILILGWSERGREVVQELNRYVQHGSVVHVVHHEDISSEIDEMRRQCTAIGISVTLGDPTTRKVLDSLDASRFDSIVVLADRTLGGIQEADARTLMCVIHLRDIIGASGTSVNIVTEMLDDRNRALASVSSDHDFIVSNKITSLLLTQIAENPDLASVFAELFDADGTEIYLKPIAEYVRTGMRVNFATVTEAAARRHEIAIGHRCTTNGTTDIEVNVEKSSSRIYAPTDSIIVIANG
jgi:Trk K+ transport system NAD-binding subunit